MKKLIIGLLICLLVMGLTGCVVTFNGHTSLNHYEDAEKYTVGDFAYAAKDVKCVEVNWVAGSINVVRKAGDTLQVSETGELTEAQKLHWLLRDGVLKIQYCASDFSGQMPPKSKELTLEIPEGIDLSIDSVSGDVLLGDGTFGELELDATSGKIDFGTVQAQKCRLDTVSGGIQGDKLLCGKSCRVDSISGNVQIDWLEAPETKAETVSGNIRLTLALGQEADISSTSGSVILKLGETLGGATVEFDTVSGSLHADGYRMEGGRYIFGGGSCEIEAETTSGSLTIK